VAALSSASAMAQACPLADDSVIKQYRDLHQSAARVYNKALWNSNVLKPSPPTRARLII
jgi:hypothetical protein